MSSSSEHVYSGGAERYRSIVQTAADGIISIGVDGEQALAPIEAEAPDACVLDAARSGWGLEVVRRVRAEPATAVLTVVSLTAAARLTDEASGHEAGAGAFLTKPASPAALVAAIRRLLSERMGAPERHCRPCARP